VSNKLLSPGRPTAELRPGPVDDIRSGRPYLLSPAPFKTIARRLASIFCLVVLDLVGLALGLYGALVIRELAFGHTPILWGVLWREGVSEWLPFLGLVTLLVFARGHLYAPRETREGAARVASSLLLVGVLTLAYGLAVGHQFTTFGLFPLAFLTSTAIIAGLRTSYESLTGNLLRVGGVRRRAVLVGVGDSVTHLHRTLGESRGGIAYVFVGAVAPAQEGVDLPVLGDRAGLPSVLATHAVDELIVSNAGMSEAELAELVEQAHRRGVKVRVAPETTELLVQKGEFVPGQGVPLFELRPPVFAGTDWAVKRTFDIAVSALVLVLGAPVWLLIAALVKLTSRGPVLHGDRRIGLGEHEFRMLKFRTMVADAERQQEALERANEASGALFKIRDDPRVTPVGRVLRRLSLDEFPNVLNVLRGEMSLVGPRPLPVRDFEMLEPWHRKRYLVLPGMTGLWQISRRDDLSFDDLVRLDFYYLENWSIWLDITVLLKTVPAVLARRGAY
jgi:exopolysaccharide biosynthesis polyprenyl glycosylphosphotransferase